MQEKKKSSNVHWKWHWVLCPCAAITIKNQIDGQHYYKGSGFPTINFKTDHLGHETSSSPKIITSRLILQLNRMSNYARGNFNAHITKPTQPRARFFKQSKVKQQQQWLYIHIKAPKKLPGWVTHQQQS